MERADKFQVCRVVSSCRFCETPCIETTFESLRKTNKEKARKVKAVETTNTEQKTPETIKKISLKSVEVSDRSLKLNKPSVEVKNIKDSKFLGNLKGHSANEPKAEQLVSIETFEEREENSGKIVNQKSSSEADGYELSAALINRESFERQVEAAEDDTSKTSARARETFEEDEGYESHKPISANELSVEDNKSHKTFNELESVAKSTESLKLNEGTKDLGIEEDLMEHEVYKAHQSFGNDPESQKPFKATEFLMNSEVSKEDDESDSKVYGKGFFDKVSFEQNVHSKLLFQIENQLEKTASRVCRCYEEKY